MLRLFKELNIWYERLVMLILGLFLLIILWCFYDSWYVYSHVTDDSVMRYKPGVSDTTKEAPALSEDMAGWLTIDDTGIDYPVMHYKDNIKYLNTDPFGRYSLGGSIFLDYRNDPCFTDDYSLIYGHHMQHGRMFGALDNYLDEAYMREHSGGTLFIRKDGEKSKHIKIFAALQTSADEKTVFNPGEGDIRRYIRSHAAVQISEPDGAIVGLSTCTGRDDDTRTGVFARIIKT